MKIRNKTALIFILLTMGAMLFAFTFVYFIFKQNNKEDFSIRLREKADLTSQKYFEKDELEKAAYKKIFNSYSKNMPEAQEFIISTKNKKSTYNSILKIVDDSTLASLLASGKDITFSKNDLQGVGIYYPDNQGTFIIIITAVDKYGILKLHKLLNSLILIFFGSVVFSYLIGIFYAKKVFEPINHIIEDVKNINANNIKNRLNEYPTNDEISELSGLLNQMLDNLDSSFQTQKHFISNASHELKNPLTAILGETEITLSRTRSVKDYIESLNKVMTEAERLDSLINGLFNIARADFVISKHNMEIINLFGFIEEIKNHFDDSIYKNRIEYKFSTAENELRIILFYGIRDLLCMALENVIENACKFSDNQIVIVNLITNQKFIHFEVIDMGIGIPEQDQVEIFEPFFRSTNAISIKGTGIGLSITQRIIQLHKGEIKITSKVGEGTQARIKLLTI